VETEVLCTGCPAESGTRTGVCTNHFVLYRAFLIAGLRVVLLALSLLHGRDDGSRTAVLSRTYSRFQKNSNLDECLSGCKGLIGILPKPYVVVM
jgi:hypothetical protein